MLSVQLHNTWRRGGAYLADLTDQISNWRHITRRIGGWWTATAEYAGTRAELDEMFYSGLLKEIYASRNGFPVWQGFIGAMSYQRDGVPWIITINDVANAVKGLYSRVGENLCTNGSAESGAWTVYNGATVAQSTDWVTDGDYSCKITVADTTVRGADIETSLQIYSETAYNVSVDLHVDGGSWRIAVNKTGDDAKVVAKSTKSKQGDIKIQMSIPATNTYEGTVRFRITSEAAIGSVYCDRAVIQTAPVPATTNWKIDTNSLHEYGQIERILSLPIMTADTANAKARTALEESAWPISQPPDEFTALAGAPANRLTLSLFGNVWCLRFLYSRIAGVNTMSDTVRAAVTQQSEYLLPGVIEENDADYQVDDSDPITLWKALSEMALAGDEAGQRWALGVYTDHRLNYQAVADDIAYEFDGGLPYSPGGGPIEPQMALPGWAQFSDAPLTPGSLAGNANRVTTKAYLEEVEYDGETDQLTFRRTRANDA